MVDVPTSFFAGKLKSLGGLYSKEKSVGALEVGAVGGVDRKETCVTRRHDSRDSRSIASGSTAERRGCGDPRKASVYGNEGGKEKCGDHDDSVARDFLRARGASGVSSGSERRAVVEIKKDALIAAAKILNMVPQRAGIPSSDYVRVIARRKELEFALASSVSGVVRIAATNGTATPVEEIFFIDRRLFLPFVLLGEQAGKADFRAELEEKVWKLRQGSRAAELGLRADAVAGYGKWKELDASKEIKLSEELTKMLIASNSCATADPALQHLNCVYIGGKVVLSTNEMTLFLGTKAQSNLRIPFPVGVIPLLGDGLVKGVAVEGDRVILDCGVGYVEGVVSAVTQEKFPKKKIVEQMGKARGWPQIAKLPAKKLAATLGRLSEYLAGVRREDWVLRMELGNGSGKVSVQVLQGKFEEKFVAEGATTEAVVEWPLERVLPVLTYMAEKGETVRIRVDEKKKTPYCISGKDVELMVGRRAKKR